MSGHIRRWRPKPSRLHVPRSQLPQLRDYPVRQRVAVGAHLAQEGHMTKELVTGEDGVAVSPTAALQEQRTMAQAVEVAYKQLQRQLSGPSTPRLACGCSAMISPIHVTIDAEGTVIKATCGVCGKAIGAPILVGPT